MTYFVYFFFFLFVSLLFVMFLFQWKRSKRNLPKRHRKLTFLFVLIYSYFNDSHSSFTVAISFFFGIGELEVNQFLSNFLAFQFSEFNGNFLMKVNGIHFYFLLYDFIYFSYIYNVSQHAKRGLMNNLLKSLFSLDHSQVRTLRCHDSFYSHTLSTLNSSSSVGALDIQILTITSPPW